MQKIILTAIILTICNVAAVHGLTNEEQVISSTAMIDHLDIMLLESWPVQVKVMVHGYFPDSCTQIDTVTTKIIQQTFYVTVTTIRPGQLACNQMLVPFKEIVPLETKGLAAGNYTVNINGVTETFTLETEEPVQ